MSQNRTVMGLLLLAVFCASPGLTSAASGRFDALPDGIIAPEDISGLAMFGEFLLVGADEAKLVSEDPEKGLNAVQVLSRSSGGQLELDADRQIDLFEGTEDKQGGTEMDIEGIAVEGDTVIVVGSHSAKRPRLKENKKYAKNREKLEAKAILPEPNRGRIYRLTLDDDARVVAKKHISLSKLLAKHPVLGLYVPLPSKENGIDIEGVALSAGKLYLGFRGPVFRDGYVPVMVLDFDRPKKNELLFVRLGGRGIRDITRVEDGFLIIAGAVGDGPASYQLYHWDGSDMVPGKKRKGQDLGVVRLLAEIDPPASGKAEGVTVITETDSGYHLLIAFDGVEDTGQVLLHMSVSKKGMQ